MLGIREEMQAGRRDLDAFEVAPRGTPTTLVIYDTMPGGTGYLPKLLHDEGTGLRAAARTVLERLEGCDSERSCHRCLRDFWNQRDHRVLNRHEVIHTLRHLAADPGHALEPTEDELLASFLEREFFERLGRRRYRQLYDTVAARRRHRHVQHTPSADAASVRNCGTPTSQQGLLEPDAVKAASPVLRLG